MSEYEEPTLFDSMVKPKLSPAYPDPCTLGYFRQSACLAGRGDEKYFETNLGTLWL